MIQDIESYIKKIQEEKDIFSKAKYIKFLLSESGIKIAELAKKISLTPSYLCHLNRLLNLPEMIVDGYYSKTIGISQLFLISRIHDQKKMIDIYEEVLKNTYTIRQTEEKIREHLYNIKTKGNYIRPREKEIILEKLKTKHPDSQISISQTRTKGKIEILIKGDLQKTSKKIKQILENI